MHYYQDNVYSWKSVDEAIESFELELGTIAPGEVNHCRHGQLLSIAGVTPVLPSEFVTGSQLRLTGETKNPLGTDHNFDFSSMDPQARGGNILGQVPADSPLGVAASDACRAILRSALQLYMVCGLDYENIDRCLRFELRIAATPNFTQSGYIGAAAAAFCSRLFQQDENPPMYSVYCVSALPRSSVIQLDFDFVLKS